jgi:hypothetical protein
MPPSSAAQVATITAYGDMARLHGSRRGVTQHVRAVFDNLLQDGGHEIQLAVLRALSKAITPEPGVRTVAGADVLEYLMQKVQFLLLHMQTTLQASRTHEQLRETGSLLLGIVHAVNLHESKESRIQSYVSAAGDSLQRLRTVLDESQLESLGTISRPTTTHSIRPSPPPSPPPERVVHAAEEASAAAAAPLQHAPSFGQGLQSQQSQLQRTSQSQLQQQRTSQSQLQQQRTSQSQLQHQRTSQSQVQLQREQSFQQQQAAALQQQQQQQQQQNPGSASKNRLSGFRALMGNFKAKHLQGPAGSDTPEAAAPPAGFFDDE